jgi:aryl-alcohol dehydrogenase-like predicted oxidoreductase
VQALVLGTAQWGNAYGVTNDQGRLTDAGISGIAEAALTAGISLVDTAGDYGDAESRLAPWAQRFSVTTKVKGDAVEPIADQLRASVHRLGVDHVRCCLVHDWPSLTDAKAVAAAAQLRELKDSGLVQSIGISGYDEADLLRIQDCFADLDAVQIPVSILDRRLDGTAALEALIAAGVEIQARSVFLQGLLVSESTTGLGSHPDVQQFHSLCADRGLAPTAVALSYVRGLAWVQQVVVGVTSGFELVEILSSWNDAGDIDLGGFVASADLALIDPRQWVR